MAKGKISLDEIELERNKKLSPLLKASIALIMVVLVSAGLFAISLSVNRNSVPPELPAIDQIEQSVTGKSIKEDQESVVNTVITTLSDVKQSQNQEELLEVLNNIENGDLDVFGEEYLSSIYFPTVVQSDIIYQTLAHQSLYSLASILSNFGNQEIAVVDTSSYEQVYIDELTGRAYVPIAIFTTDNNPIVLELVFVNGEWLIDPYSYTQAVKMSAQLQAQG